MSTQGLRKHINLKTFEANPPAPLDPKKAEIKGMDPPELQRKKGRKNVGQVALFLRTTRPSTGQKSTADP